MASQFFMQAYLLQAIGWGIINSLWQSGLLWLLYKAIINYNKKIPALFKHHLSLLCLLGSLVWFLFTVVTCYFSLKTTQSFPAGFGLISNKFLSVVLNFLLPLVSSLYIGFLCFYTFQLCNQFFFQLPLRNQNLIKIPVAFRLFTLQAALHLGISKKVSVWLSGSVDVPSVSGFFKPIIVLPFTLLNQLSTTQVEAILLHELAHIKRADYLINLLQLMAEKILFFNPFSILLSVTLKEEREKCCDDWVLNYQYNRKDYAAALLIVETHRIKQTDLALAATNGKRNLLHRVQRIFIALPVTHFNTTQQLKLLSTGLVIITGLLLLRPALQTPVKNNNVVKNKPAFTKSLQTKQITLAKERNPILKLNMTKVSAAMVKKNKVTKHPAIAPTTMEDYPVAFINKALLDKDIDPVNAGLNIVNTEKTNNQSAFIKVEEENNGIEGKKVYYVELKKKNGKTEIKPLVFVNWQQKNKAVKPDKKNQY